MAGICQTCGMPKESCVGEDLGRETTQLSVEMDTRRYGKAVTVVRGLESKPDEAEKLARDLKKGLATGGSGKGGVIVLQGDHRKDVVRLLQSKGYNVRGRRRLSRTAPFRRRRAGGTLKAVVVPRFGGPQGLDLDWNHPDPVPCASPALGLV